MIHNGWWLVGIARACIILIGQTIHVGIHPRMGAIRSRRQRVVRVGPSGPFMEIDEPVAVAVRRSSGDRKDIELEVGAWGTRPDPDIAAFG